MRFIFGAVLAIVSSLSFAGYSATGNCYATLSEAASRAAYYYNASGQCASGECRILSYVPTSGTVQVISNGQILGLTIPACDVANSTLPSYIQPSPWYGSDPGTVSACGNVVSTTGGISGSGSGGSGPVELLPFSISLLDAQTLVVSILMLWAVAWIFKAISRALRVDERDEE